MTNVISFPTGEDHKIAMLVQEYLADLKRRRYSRHTIRSYATSLGILVDKFEEINGITTLDLIRLLDNPVWDKNTVAARQAAVKSFFIWAHDQQFINVNPAEALGGIMPKKTLPRPIPDDDIEKILNAAKGIPLVPRTLFFLLPDHALRVDEGLALDVNDVRWIKGQELIVVRHGKGDKERVIPFTWEMPSTVLLKRLCSQQQSGALFTTRNRIRANYDWAYYWWQKTLSIAGIGGYTIHQLRHTGITNMFREGRNPAAIKRIAGHVKYQSTEIYTQVLCDDLRKEIEKPRRK